MYREEKNYDTNFGRPRSQEEIASLFPEGNFIVVFGTSHTSGCCEKGEFTHIDVEDRWCNIVADHYGLPVVNLSLPGNYNRFIVQQVIDFLELPDVKERCNLVLLEARTGDLAGKYYFDLFADEPHGGIPVNRHIVNSDLIKGISWMDAIVGPFVPIKQNKDSYVRGLILSANPNFGSLEMVPTPAVEQMQNIISTFASTVLLSQQQAVEDMLDIRIIQHLITSRGIPFRFFVWDPMKIGNGKYYQKTRQVYDELYNMNKYIVKGLYPNATDAACREVGNSKWNIDWDCDCGHRDEGAHKWVASKIIDELKEILR